MQKTDVLTTFRREDYNLHTQLNNKYLTSALGSQYYPANYDQNHRPRTGHPDAQPGSSLDITRGYWALTVENDLEKYSGNAKVFYNFGTHKISDGFYSNDNNYGLNISESAKLFHGNSITLGCDYTNYGGKATQDIGG